MKRILHILGDSGFGGGTYIVSKICEGAKNAGHNVAVLTTDHRSKLFFEEKGILVYDIDCIWRPIRPIKDFIGLVKLCSFLLKTDFNIVHTHTSKGGFVGRLAAFVAKRKIIIHTVHGFAFHEQSPNHIILFYTLLEKFAAKFCHRIVTVSHYHRNWAINLKICRPQKLISIPNGIEFAKDLHKIDLYLPKEVYDDNIRVILNVGRVAQQKGIEFLIQAIKELVEDGVNDFICIVVGDGGEFERLKAEVKKLNLGNYIALLGRSNHPRSLLPLADFVVLPSEREGLSISLLEAFASRKPVITTSIGSNIEVSQNGLGALLVKPADVFSLKAAIKKFIDEPKFAEEIGRKGFDIFNQNYQTKAMQVGYMNLYEELWLLKNKSCIKVKK